MPRMDRIPPLQTYCFEGAPAAFFVFFIFAFLEPCAAQEEREAREEREKRKQENKEKGVQYQVISNTSKIKKMSKKQLRLIKKADTSGVAPKVYDKASK